MAQVLTQAYTDILEFINPNGTGNTFNGIELLNSGTSQVQATTADSRVTVTTVAGNNPYTVQITVSPSNADVNSGDTFDESRIYNGDPSTASPVTARETFTSVTLQQNDDELVVDHDIEVPQI